MTAIDDDDGSYAWVGSAVSFGASYSMKFNVCNLHTAVYKFSHIITEYDLTISLQNTKLVAFKQRDPVRDKIVIDNKIIEQVNPFNYLGTLITYEKEVDIDNILNKYLKITGIIKICLDHRKQD